MQGEAEAFVAGACEAMLEAVFLALDDSARPLGFIELSIRAFADGCDSRPVPHVEGWYVEPSARRTGIGRLLMSAAEDWARALGFSELASDTEVENVASQEAHARCGFSETERLVKFRKRLGNKVTIRNCELGDLDELVSLFTKVVQERIWLGTEPGFDQAKYRERWAQMVNGHGGVVFVAVQGAALVGYIGIHPGSNHSCTIGMAVRDGHRGQGIGSALLRQAIQWAERRGEVELFLGVFPHNTAAIRLYEKHGFKESCRRDGFATRQNGDVWDMIEMTLPIKRS
jgi:aminoglycoside 6'-N-acetyltransferase I